MVELSVGEIMVDMMRLFGMFCIAIVVGKIVAKFKLPAILGWLVAAIIFGPYLVGFFAIEMMSASWYQLLMRTLECFAGVMIGKEIIVTELKKSGKQIFGITLVQSLGTFIFVSITFALVFAIMNIPIFLAFIFGGIALATAPVPALSIINEFRTKGAVTNTLIPLAAIDDVIGIVVFFGVITIVSAVFDGASVSVIGVVGMVLIPFIIGTLTGISAALVMRKMSNKFVILFTLILFLILSVVAGLLVDYYIYHAFSLNYLLIGMTFSAVVVNMVDTARLAPALKLYQPLLNVSLVMVIINLGMPLNYRLIAGAGLYTLIYIVSRAIGKIGCAYLGGKITHADKNVTKYLGLTLLPHSGVSLIFTGVAVTALNGIDTGLADILQGTIVAAAIINELIAVTIAKIAFNKAGEIPCDKFRSNVAIELAPPEYVEPQM